MGDVVKIYTLHISQMSVARF